LDLNKKKKRLEGKLQTNIAEKSLKKMLFNRVYFKFLKTSSLTSAQVSLLSSDTAKALPKKKVKFYFELSFTKVSNLMMTQNYNPTFKKH
jgi:hypothetical protein